MVSSCTKEQIDNLKTELYGGQIEDDTFLYMLTEEILDEHH